MEARPEDDLVFNKLCVPRDDPYGASTACPCCFLILSYLMAEPPELL